MGKKRIRDKGKYRKKDMVSQRETVRDIEIKHSRGDKERHREIWWEWSDIKPIFP